MLYLRKYMFWGPLITKCFTKHLHISVFCFLHLYILCECCIPPPPPSKQKTHISVFSVMKFHANYISGVFLFSFIEVQNNVWMRIDKIVKISKSAEPTNFLLFFSRKQEHLNHYKSQGLHNLVKTRQYVWLLD